MKILKMCVLVMLFAMNVAPYSEAENTVSFMFPWGNPDPCGGEDCLGSAEQGMDV
jgi:hypothetical protein